MARADFMLQLQALGYDVEDKGSNFYAFRYRIPVGKMMGKEVGLAFEVADDFPLNPPGGPHVSPKVHPNLSGGAHPTGGIHDSILGLEWQYWSRPFKEWSKTNRSVKAYMAHIRHLFDTQ